MMENAKTLETANRNMDSEFSAAKEQEI